MLAPCGIHKRNAPYRIIPDIGRNVFNNAFGKFNVFKVDLRANTIILTNDIENYTIFVGERQRAHLARSTFVVNIVLSITSKDKRTESIDLLHKVYCLNIMLNQRRLV